MKASNKAGLEFIDLLKRVTGNKLANGGTYGKTLVVAGPDFSGINVLTLHYDGQIAASYTVQCVGALRTHDYDPKLMKKCLRDLKRLLVLEDLANL